MYNHAFQSSQQQYSAKNEIFSEAEGWQAMGQKEGCWVNLSEVLDGSSELVASCYPKLCLISVFIEASDTRLTQETEMED